MSEPAGATGPEPLSLRFANTRYAVRGQARDHIATPELLQAWLARHADELGAAPEVVPADVPAFADLRDAVRELIAVAIPVVVLGGDPAPAHEDAVALLNRLSAGAPTWPTLVRADGRFQVIRRATGDGRTLALATLARDAITLLTGELAGGLRACGAAGCVQFFVKDHPRREWCSTACGNRVRAARHYLRRRDDR